MSKPADSSLDRIRRHLVGLKMPCALESLQDTVQRIERGELSTFEAIEALLGEELTTRQSRRIKMALQTARLSTIKTLSAVDLQKIGCRYVVDENVLLLKRVAGDVEQLVEKLIKKMVEAMSTAEEKA